MNPTLSTHSGAWISFTYANLLVSSAITVTKTVRDVQEAAKLVDKIEDAKTEQLLMRIDRT